jgi:hypothetical protein
MFSIHITSQIVNLKTIGEVFVLKKCYQCGGETLGTVVKHSVRDSIPWARDGSHLETLPQPCYNLKKYQKGSRRVCVSSPIHHWHLQCLGREWWSTQGVTWVWYGRGGVENVVVTWLLLRCSSFGPAVMVAVAAWSATSTHS